MPDTPKHRELSRRLRADIAAGRYAAEGKLPSEPQLVKQFGVSRPTVARALLDLQNEGLIERRAGSGTYLRRTTGAAVNSTRQLGLLIPGLGNTEVFERVCGELASLSRVHEYSLLWGGSTHPGQDTDASLEHAEELCGHFIDRRVSGVFFAPYELVPEKESANRRLAETLRQAGIPVVLLDRDLQSFPNRSDFDLVGIDNVAGGYLLAEHLIKLGCRHICFVARPLSAPTVDARIAGVREALVRRQLDAGPRWLRVGDPADVKFARSLTAAKQADAFICANDHTAAQLLRSLEACGVKVPRDVRVVGFDDVKYATLLAVPLTTIHQPCRDIAVIALRAMLERIADPTLPARSLALTPRLVVRESCGAYLPRPASSLLVSNRSKTK
ncbi:MAG: GntR family transcriptional regulator [Verrucomicrobia bacterium]|nr:GntR family transcriptional regulator [Verrucomicrobiota bacterium]MBI3867445.1 GntR family transcriptional regulator [Verrucomicrobiota bacterium]